MKRFLTLQEPVATGRVVSANWVLPDAATHNQGKVQLGDGAPIFAPPSVRPGDKVMRDAATHNQGKVQLGDGAPIFAPPSVRPGGLQRLRHDHSMLTPATFLGALWQRGF
jgi:hypothetical protein